MADLMLEQMYWEICEAWLKDCEDACVEMRELLEKALRNMEELAS